MMLVVGFDFYIYSNRYLIKNRLKVGFSIINQFAFHLLSYVVLIIIFLILNYFDLFSKYSTVLILVLILFEHLGTEFFRLFIAMEKVLIANVLLFLRTGTWPLILIYQMIFTDLDITINSIVFYWTLASFLTVLISFLFVYKDLRLAKLSVDIKWVKRGFNVGILFFTATIAQKIIEFSDRYIIDSILGAKSLGIYTFYFQLANLSNVAIFTVLISFTYPKIIRFVESKDKLETYSQLKKLQQNIIIFILSYAFIIFLILPYILVIVGKPELEKYSVILFLFLLGNLFLNLSFGGHYLLMGMEKDRLLMKIGLKIAAVNIILNLTAITFFGIKGAVVVFVLSSFLLFISKREVAKKYVRNYGWKN